MTNLSNLPPVIVHSRILSMTDEDLRSLSGQDSVLALEILRAHKHQYTQSMSTDHSLSNTLNNVHRDASGKTNYNRTLSLTDNIGNWLGNLQKGAGGILQGMFSPIDAAQGAASLVTGGLGHLQERIEDTGFMPPREPTNDPEFEARRRLNQQAASGMGQQISDLGDSLATNPGGVLFRNPAEIATLLAPPAKLAGLGRTHPAVNAALAAADFPITGLKLGKKAVTNVAGPLIAKVAERSGKALSGVGLERQGLIRHIAETPAATATQLERATPADRRLISGLGIGGLQDAMGRGKGTLPRGLKPGEIPPYIGEGPTLQDDIINSVVQTKEILNAQANAAEEAVKLLKIQQKNQQKTVFEGPTVTSTRDVPPGTASRGTPIRPVEEVPGSAAPIDPGTTIIPSQYRTYPEEVAPNLQGLPPIRSDIPVRPLPERAAELGPHPTGEALSADRLLRKVIVDEHGNVVQHAQSVGSPASGVPGQVQRPLAGRAPEQPRTGTPEAPEAPEPIQLVTDETINTAVGEAGQLRQLSDAVDGMLPSNNTDQLLAIPAVVARLTEKGSEAHLNKIMEAQSRTGIPVLPRALGHSVSSGSTTSLAGANVAIEVLRQPATWIIAAGTGALTAQFGYNALPLLLAVPFTSQRVVARTLMANGWTRQQLKPVADMTNALMDIPGIKELAGTGITYGGLMQQLGISEEDITRGNNQQKSFICQWREAN